MKIARLGSRVPSVTVRTSSAFVPPAAVTLLALPEDHPATAVVALLYLLGVVIAARMGGAWAGVGASVLSFFALNFFFTSPLHTLEVGAPEDLVSLFVFLVASVVVGVLLSRALEEQAKAERREVEARLVNRLATRLLGGDSTEEVLAEFAEGLLAVFNLDGCNVTTTFEEVQSVSAGSSTGKPESVPLRARGKDLGEMKLWRRSSFNEDENAVIRSLATQLALALEGMRLSGEVRRAEIEASTSQLKAALFSGVTHDVKTPLAAITTSATSLIDGRGFSDSDRRAHLETIKQEADRLHRVVTNLLDLARMRAGALVPLKVATPVEEVMESVLNRLRPLLANRTVEIRVGDDVPEVPMDVVQIDQVLSNLVENAIKFSPPASPIVLSAVGNTEGVRVTVSDRGAGVPEAARHRIFEAFEQVDERHPGTGLGLAICQAIVAVHGGRIWVSENPSGGSAFTFELPGTASRSEEEVTHAGTGATR